MKTIEGNNWCQRSRNIAINIAADNLVHRNRRTTDHDLDPHQEAGSHPRIDSPSELDLQEGFSTIRRKGPHSLKTRNKERRRRLT